MKQYARAYEIEFLGERCRLLRLFAEHWRRSFGWGAVHRQRFELVIEGERGCRCPAAWIVAVWEEEVDFPW